MSHVAKIAGKFYLGIKHFGLSVLALYAAQNVAPRSFAVNVHWFNSGIRECVILMDRP